VARKTDTQVVVKILAQALQVAVDAVIEVAPRTHDANEILDKGTEALARHVVGGPDTLYTNRRTTFDISLAKGVTFHWESTHYRKSTRVRVMVLFNEGTKNAKNIAKVVIKRLTESGIKNLSVIS